MASNDNISVSYFLRTREGCKLTVTASKFGYCLDNLYQEDKSEIDTEQKPNQDPATGNLAYLIAG